MRGWITKLLGAAVLCGSLAQPATADDSWIRGRWIGATNALGGRTMIDRRSEPAEATRIVSRNLTGAVSVLTYCAEYLRVRGEGCIVGLSSVAGDRGRQSNYAYGAAKAGLSTYLQGLRNRLHPAGVRVTTVKPGFVDTAMTFGMDGLFLVASPEYVGERIARLMETRAKVVYLPWFWRYIMWIIRCIPEFLFKRLKL